MRILPASSVAVLVVVAGRGVVRSQPSDKFESDEISMKVFVWDGSETVSVEGKNEIVDVL